MINAADVAVAKPTSVQMPAGMTENAVSGRIAHKLRNVSLAARSAVSKWMAQAYYSLPWWAKHNPRQQVVQCKGSCLELSKFPGDNSGFSDDWYLRIRDREIVVRRPPICLDELDASRFLSGALKYQNGEQGEIPEIFLSCFQNCRLVGKDFLLLPKGNRILLESALGDYGVLESSGVLDRIRRPKAKKLSGSFALISHPWAWGFYHWVLEVLPKLSSIEKFPELSTLRFIVPHASKKFQKESLLEAGVPQDRLVILDDGDWEVERLYFAEVLGPSGTPSPHAVEWLRTTFIRNSDGLVSQNGGGKIYLSRQDAPQRRLRNEEEIISFLETKGFKTVQSGNLSFREQVTLFQQASFIVAPHGAALTNLVFAPRDCKVIEMFGDNYINGCYWALANLRGQDYGCLTASTDTLDYSVSIGRLSLLMDKMLGSTASIREYAGS
jgi:Glycosyltransferase 61